MAVQHLFYPRTLKGDRRLGVTEHAAGQSKGGPKAKTSTTLIFETTDTLYFNNF